MRQTRTLLLVVLVVSSTVVAIAQQTPQLTVVPPKPTCTLLFKTGSCADLWTNYNQAVARRQQEEIQLYVNRQKELASQAATAPLQQQIADLTILTEGQQTQIKKLQRKIESDASAALEARVNAHQQGLWEGVATGGAGVLILIAVILGVRRISGSFTITKKSQPA
jgi:hypothetical protein